MAERPGIAVFLYSFPGGRKPCPKVFSRFFSTARDADAASQETARLTVEQGLNAVTLAADELMGVEPVAPAPLTAAEVAA